MAEPETLLRCRNELGESPTWVADEGALYWVDITGKTVNRYVPVTKEHDSWETPELACGIVPRASGGMVVAFPHSLHAFGTRSGTLEQLGTVDPERSSSRNNDMKCGPHGRLWVGTMRYQDGGPDEEATGALYVYAEGKATRVLDDIGISNTLAWTPDNSRFFFADSTKNVIWSFDYRDGALTNQQPFFEGEDMGSPDGSAMDSEGFLWNARYGGGCVVRIAPDGTVDKITELPVTNPTSCAFGGDDLKTLYITSAAQGLDDDRLEKHPEEGGLLALDPGVAGMPVQAFAG